MNRTRAIDLACFLEGRQLFIYCKAGFTCFLLILLIIRTLPVNTRPEATTLWEEIIDGSEKHHTHKLPPHMTEPLGSQLKTGDGECTDTLISTAKRFSFNVTNENTTTSQWYFLDSLNHQSLRGSVRLMRGDIFQGSNLEALFTISSTDAGAIDNVILNPSASTLSMDYISTIKSGSICTEVKIIVFLRPYSVRVLDIFSLRSNMLDIDIEGYLEWSIKHLITHSSSGSTHYRTQGFPGSFFPFNISASAITGNIFVYTTGSNIAIRNEKGVIDFALLHLDENKPLELESISLTSKSGGISMQSSIDWLPT